MNNIRPVEQALADRVIAATAKNMGFTGTKIVSVERKSDKDFDVKIECSCDICKFGLWLPLAAIRELTMWTSPGIAAMTDYPDMTASGDWSGVRDTNEDALWAIFNEHVIEETLRRSLTRKTK